MKKHINKTTDIIKAKSYIYYGVINKKYTIEDQPHILVRYGRSSDDEEHFLVSYNEMLFDFPDVRALKHYFNLELDYLYETTSLAQ